VGIDRETLPMKLAEGNCHAESVAGEISGTAHTKPLRIIV